MNNAILTNMGEPSDAALQQLMTEVARDAKVKADIAQKQLTETIKQQIAKAATKR